MAHSFACRKHKKKSVSLHIYSSCAVSRSSVERPTGPSDHSMWAPERHHNVIHWVTVTAAKLFLLLVWGLGGLNQKNMETICMCCQRCNKSNTSKATSAQFVCLLSIFSTLQMNFTWSTNPTCAWAARHWRKTTHIDMIWPLWHDLRPFMVSVFQCRMTFRSRMLSLFKIA